MEHTDNLPTLTESEARRVLGLVTAAEARERAQEYARDGNWNDAGYFYRLAAELEE